MDSEFVSGMDQGAEAVESQSSPAETQEGFGSSTPSPEQLHAIKWNGQEKQLPYSELVKLAQQGFDYTQKAQGLSARERQYQAQVAQYDQALREAVGFLQDRERLKAYLQQLEGQGQQAAASSADPDTLITQRDLEAKLQQMTAAQQQQFMKQLGSAFNELKVEQLAGTYSEQIDATINGILENTPDLKAIPRIQRLLKEEVRAMKPQSIDDAKQMLRQVAENFSGQFSGYLTERQKQAVVQKAPLARGIEPPGGSPPAAPPTPNFKRVNDPRLREMVIQDLQKAFSGGGGI